VHRPTTTLTGVAFSPDGKTLATGSYDRIVKLWNIATQQEVATLRAYTILHTAVSSESGIPIWFPAEANSTEAGDRISGGHSYCGCQMSANRPL
jgi:WD40 repeat protein